MCRFGVLVESAASFMQGARRRVLHMIFKLTAIVRFDTGRLQPDYFLYNI